MCRGKACGCARDGVFIWWQTIPTGRDLCAWPISLQRLLQRRDSNVSYFLLLWIDFPTLFFFFLFFWGPSIFICKIPKLCFFGFMTIVFLGSTIFPFLFVESRLLAPSKRVQFSAEMKKKRKLMDILFCSWLQAWNSWWGWLVTQWWYWVLAPRWQAKNHWPVCIIFSHVPPTLSKVPPWILKSDPYTENLPCVFPEVLPCIT